MTSRAPIASLGPLTADFFNSIDASRRGEIVGFGGSGTTLISAEKTGRRARVIELEPRFVYVAIRRYQKLTGRAARHAETGQGFEERRAPATGA